MAVIFNIFRWVGGGWGWGGFMKLRRLGDVSGSDGGET